MKIGTRVVAQETIVADYEIVARPGDLGTVVVEDENSPTVRFDNGLATIVDPTYEVIPAGSFAFA